MMCSLPLTFLGAVVGDCFVDSDKAAVEATSTPATSEAMAIFFMAGRWGLSIQSPSLSLDEASGALRAESLVCVGKY